MRTLSRIGPVHGIALAIFVGTLVYLGAGARVGADRDIPSFDIDEAHKLSETYYYHLFVERGDWNAPDWSEDFYARTNPPVAKYIFGLALAIRGQHVHDQELQRDFDALWRRPEMLRDRVPDPMLRVTRATSRLFAALVCALVAWIAGRVGGLPAAILAPGWLLLHPMFQFVGSRGLTDSILLFHLLLIVPVSWGALRALDVFDTRANPTVSAWAGLCARSVLLPAVVIALAAGTKLNGAIAGPAYAATMLCWAWVGTADRRGTRLARAAALVAATALTSVALFMLVNPYFHAQPFERAMALPGVVGNWMVKQQLSPGGGLFGVREKFATAGWVTLFAPYLALPRLAGLAGILPAVLAVGVGAGALLRRCFTMPADETSHALHRRRRVVAAACWIALVPTFVTLWAPVAWLRYFLPPAIGVGLLFGIGISAATSGLIRQVGRYRERQASSIPRTGVLAVALALAVWTGGVFRLVDPTVLDSRRLGMPATRESLEAQREAVSRHPGSSVRHRLLGNLLHAAGDTDGASREFEEAVRLLPADTRDVNVAVQRAITLFDLARASSDAGDANRSHAALREHLTIVRELRDRANDPHVRREFERILVERSSD